MIDWGTMDPLGGAMEWILAFGLLGLIAIFVLERVIPVLPSYALLIPVGVGSAEGVWRLEAAFAATTIGGVLGCGVIYSAGRMLGERRVTAGVKRGGPFIGLAARHVDGLVVKFRQHQALLGFGAQLIPTVRLIAPVVGGFVASRPFCFALATVAGVAIWNAAFLGLGFAAHQMDATGNLTMLAVFVLIALVSSQIIVALVMRSVARRRLDNSLTVTL